MQVPSHIPIHLSKFASEAVSAGFREPADVLREAQRLHNAACKRMLRKRSEFVRQAMKEPLQ